MGAFDGELAALGYGRSAPEPSRRIAPMDTFYVSWDGCDGIGATGKHFDTEAEAQACYQTKLAEGKHPARWF